MKKTVRAPFPVSPEAGVALLRIKHDSAVVILRHDVRGCSCRKPCAGVMLSPTSKTPLQHGNKLGDLVGTLTGLKQHLAGRWFQLLHLFHRGVQMVATDCSERRTANLCVAKAPLPVYLSPHSKKERRNG